MPIAPKGPEDNNQKPLSRRPWIGTALIYIVVIAIVTFMIFFLVRPSYSSKNTKTFTNADIRQVVDEDGNISYEGELANVLENKYVTLLQTQVCTTDTQQYQIYGEYYEVTNNKIETSTLWKFNGTLDTKTSYYYVLEIVRTRSAVTVANNTITGIDPNPNNRFYNSDVYKSLTPSNNAFLSWLPTILITVVTIGAGWFAISRLNKSMKEQMKNQTDVASSKARRVTNTKTKFADVAGCDEVKSELIEIVDYFKNAQKYTRLGAKLPKGVLLVGPPGTGKTLLAKAVAGEAEVPFYSISGSDFVEMYVGVGASRVRDMFKTAKNNAPCLVFIDEIDAVGRQRGAGLGGGNDEREQTLNQLLVEMDGFADNSGVIIIAATNRADVLDPALLRAGRFDRQITVDLPDKEGREAIFKVHARGKTIADDVDFSALASRTTGFSGADIANIMNDAAILAVRERRDRITIKDIDEAIDRSISGPAKSNKHMLPEEKKQVAYHESGHAIIGLFVPHSDKVQKVTIVPRGRTGGHVMMTPEQDRFLLTESELKARIIGYLGGRTSEEIFFGDVSTGASNDIEMATKLAKAMVTQYGMSPLGLIQYGQPSGSVFLGRDYSDTTKNFSSQKAYEIDKEVYRIIEECHQEARKILLEHQEDVKLMAETLINVETLTAEQISYLLEHRELPSVDEHKISENEEEMQIREKAKTSLPYFGESPKCDKINEDFKRMFNQNPECLVILAESRSTNANSYRASTIDSTIKKFAASRKYSLLVLSIDQMDLMHITASDFGQKIETEMKTPVFLIETTKDSIKNYAEFLTKNK